MKKLLHLALLLSFLISSCSSDKQIIPPEPEPEPELTEISFKVDLDKTQGVDAEFEHIWESGDEIGIFAVKRTSEGGVTDLQASGNYIHNLKLTYNGTSWSGLAYWPADESALDFYAYYPYDNSGGTSANLNPLEMAFNVRSDQSIGTPKSNYTLSGLLTAADNNAGAGYSEGETVNLNFFHTLAIIQVRVPSDGFGFGPSENLVVTLCGVKAKVSVDLGATARPKVALALNDNEAININMYRVEQNTDENYRTNYTYRALVPAQEIESGNSLFLFNHENRLNFNDDALAVDLTMRTGKIDKFEYSLPATTVHTVPIPAGTFMMGSPETEPTRDADLEIQHSVILSSGFRMGMYPVTNLQYAAFLNDNNIPGVSVGDHFTASLNGNVLIESSRDDFATISDWGLHWENDKWVPVNEEHNNHPTIHVTWYGASEYALWIGGSLPTEAQWEYACRGDYSNKATETNTLPFGIGNGKILSGENANVDGRFEYDLDLGGTPEMNPAGIFIQKTSAVGSYPYPNNYGLYDMHGNVVEWCYDWYGAYSSEEVTDPKGPESGRLRILRGGRWISFPRFCRSATRDGMLPNHINNGIGFRIILPL